MSHKIHSQARTTPKIRAEIQACTLSDRAAAKKYNVTRQTIRKWRERENQQALSHCPHVLKTTLSPNEEIIVVERRKTLLLSLDDLLVHHPRIREPQGFESRLTAMSTATWRESNPRHHGATTT